MKIWTKLYDDDKIIRHSLYPIEGKFDQELLLDYLINICNDLDEPTPVVLNKHIRHFAEFNTTHFLPEDFVENVNFTRMVIELVPDDQSKPNKRSSNFYSML